MSTSKLAGASLPSVAVSSTPGSRGTGFPSFMQLPPELRHKIYLAAIPSPGINFFNVHSFPNDHKGANRSTSPPNLHLDLRRLSIEDDDIDVARYDPSAWQIRHALRQTCQEARIICAIPDDKVVRLTLSVPGRGLFTYAGDGLQRSMTPLEEPAKRAETVVYRHVQVHADDMVALSVENCSFNIVFEETTMFHIGRDQEDEVSLGWAYDPQFKDGVSLGIRPSRFCLNLAHDDWATMRALEEIAGALREAASGNSEASDGIDDYGSIMLDTETARKKELSRRYRSEKLAEFRDRWDDVYVSVPWDYEDLPMSLQIIKLSPERESMRERYLRSAQLKSPKRPA
ncbi:putative 2EXR domain-containing protein [Seiridium unicorne]|uniref:2EXR domain-containing protein n=1 Tax=Seiridium unicorne TaxID=138068 RepID=A0ABR2UXR7_9PEZI